MNLQKLVSNLNVEESTATDYFRRISHLLSEAPYALTVNWKGSLGIFNMNRKYSDVSDSAVREANGTIIEAFTNKVVAFSFNGIREYTEPQYDMFNNNWSDYEAERLVDGAVTRLYYYGDKWNIATLKCIDARDGHWSSNKNFQELFEEASVETGLDYSRLNRNFCYTFIVRHPSNHMIVKYERCSLIHLSTVDLSTLAFVNHDIGIPRVINEKFESFDAFLTANAVMTEAPLTEVSNLGYILTNIKTGDKTKFENPSYRMARDLKGNVPNINYQILTLMKKDWTFNTNDNVVTYKDDFLKYFPHYKTNYETMEAKFRKTVGYIFNAYLSSTNQNAHKQLDFVVQHTIDELYLIAHEENRGNMTIKRTAMYLQSLSAERLSQLLRIPIILKKNKVSRNYPRDNKLLQGFEWKQRKEYPRTIEVEQS